MSSFWEKKIHLYFDRIDFDKDGVITRKDFEGMADKFSAAGKLPTERSAQLKSSLTGVFDKYVSNISGDHQEKITKETLTESLKKMVKDPKAKSSLEGQYPLYFEAVDANADEFISAEEHREFFNILGLDPETSPATFKAIDTNNDGLLSKDEFATAGVQFFLTEDESDPANLFWGPV